MGLRGSLLLKHYTTKRKYNFQIPDSVKKKNVNVIQKYEWQIKSHLTTLSN